MYFSFVLFVLSAVPLLGSTACTSSSSSNSKVINDDIDDILEGLNQVFEQTGEAEPALSDISETFTKKVGFIKVTGTFTGTNGKGKSLATLQRTGNATLSSTPTSLTLELHLGLGQLEASYDFRLKFRLLSMSGTIGASVGTFSLKVVTTLYVDEEADTCKAVLGSVAVEALDDIDVAVSGLGSFNWLMSKILEWSADHFKDDIQSKITDQITKALVKQLAQETVCFGIYDLL